MDQATGRGSGSFPRGHDGPSRASFVRRLGGSMFAGLALATAVRTFADPLPANVPRIAVLGSRALSTSERVDAARTGRVESLPKHPRLRWSISLPNRIDQPLAVTADGALVLITSLAGSFAGEAALVELSPTTGAVRTTTRIEPAAGGPVVLQGGVRAVVTVRGDVLGIAPDGKLLFRTTLPGDPGSAPRVGLVALPDGGLSVARRSDVHQLDAHGAVVGSAHLELTPGLVARANGEVVGVTPSGDVFGWRAGTMPRSYGTFGDRSIVAVGGHLCHGGLSLDDRGSEGRKTERVLCSSDAFVDELDLVTKTRRTLLGRGALPFRTSVAVSTSGEVVVVAAGGTLVSLGSAGERTLADVPGSTLPLPAYDAGVYLPPAAEVAPLIARDGAIVFGASEGMALWQVGGTVQRLTRCGGAGTVAGIAPGPAGGLYIACADGKVELWNDSA